MGFADADDHLAVKHTAAKSLAPYPAYSSRCVQQSPERAKPAVPARDAVRTYAPTSPHQGTAVEHPS
jgi:hypothetical protein